LKEKKYMENKQIKKKIMSGKEMYERNPFSSSSYVLFLGTKKNSKEATIRGTPFHTVLDLSSNCEVACSLF